MNKWVKLRKELDGIDTPTQAWLQEQGACLAGRRAVGERSVSQFWVKAKSRAELEYLVWLVYRLGRITLNGGSYRSNEVMSAYLTAIDTAVERAGQRPKGAKRAKYFKAGVAAVMDVYKVQLPAGLL